MGILDKLFKKGAVKQEPRYARTFLQRLGLVNTYTDDSRTYIEQGYQQNPIVYAITHSIAKNASRARWYIKDKNGDEVTVPMLSNLLVQPNVRQSWGDFIQDAITHKILEGNSYVTGEFGTGINANKYNSIYIIPGENIQVIATNDHRSIRGYKVDFAWAEDEIIPATDVLHLRNPNPDFDQTDNWWYGQSSFRPATMSIQAYNESLEAGTWFLQNKGAQKILTIKDDMPISPEAEDALKSKLRAQAQGVKNNGTIPIIDGEFDIIDVSSNASDLLVLEQRDKAAMEICNVLGFPSQLIGLNSATYQNAKEAKKALWETCIIPEMDELAAGLNRWFAPQFGEYTICYSIDHIDAMRDDRPVNSYANLYTVNEVRMKLGDKPFPAGDERGEEMYMFKQGVEDESKPIDDEEKAFDYWNQFTD